MTYKLYTDGGSRGNPGPGAIGIVLINGAGEVIYEMAKYIGECTNNEAEYLGILFGLKAAQERDVSNLDVFMDSELVIKQLKGDYKVKNARLIKICNEVKSISANFNKISFTHVKRVNNKMADSLVNEALDQNGF
ncbi:ribonuclease HI family protein [Patescibacteria group bacterium]